MTSTELTPPPAGTTADASLSTPPLAVGSFPADHLACPECGAALDASLQCAAEANSHRFTRSEHGVPILLRESERKELGIDLSSAGVMNREYTPSLLQRISRVAKRLIGSTLHQPISKTVTDIWDQHNGARALEVGSGVREKRPNRVNLDISVFPNVDVVGSALRLPFVDNTFELVRSCAVLEHVREPQTMIDEMHRVLAPGGYVYTEVPFLQHFHAYPNDFQRYTVKGLEQVFADFDVLETGVCVGPSSAITALIADWFELLTFTKSRAVNDIARAIPLILLWPLKYLDYFLMKNPRAHELASGVYILARKRTDSTSTSSPND